MEIRGLPTTQQASCKSRRIGWGGWGTPTNSPSPKRKAPVALVALLPLSSSRGSSLWRRPSGGDRAEPGDARRNCCGLRGGVVTRDVLLSAGRLLVAGAPPQHVLPHFLFIFINLYQFLEKCNVFVSNFDSIKHIRW
jgi:hypothetical protein